MARHRVGKAISQLFRSIPLERLLRYVTWDIPFTV